MLARATVFGTYGGQGHINVLHFQLDAATSSAYLLLGAYVDGFWVDSHRGNVDNNMRWSRVHVEDRGGNEPTYDQPISRAGVLGPSAQFCPFLGVCFEFHTLVPGRRGRGRSFQGGYGHGNLFNFGQWLPEVQTRIDNVALALTDYWCTGNSVVGGWRLAVAPRSEHDSGILVQTIVARPLVSTMNTRKVGQGL